MIRSLAGFRSLSLSLLAVTSTGFLLLSACGPTFNSLSSLTSSGRAIGMTYAASVPASPRAYPSAAASSAPSGDAYGTTPASDASRSDEPRPLATATPLASGTPMASPASSAIPASQARAGLLTAGTWRDLDHWDFWLGLMQKQSWSAMLSYWGISPLQRIGLRLLKQERPVIDQALVLKDKSGSVMARARTDNRGQADFFTSLLSRSQNQGPYQVETEDGSGHWDQLEPSAQVRELEFANAAETSLDKVDLMMVVDTTGSMGDELEFLKVELRNVLDRAQRGSENLSLRASVNFYRDQGDAYVVRPFAFTTDFGQIQSQLRQQSSDGGGDYPEAVIDALANAFDQHEWSSRARARLLFLVLDAPPHSEAAQLARLKELIPDAQRQGIRIIPVASSGVDKETEFLMRMLAISTGGEYVFLTNDSGIGGDHIEPTIGEHKVEKLNELMVRLIQKYSS